MFSDSKRITLEDKMVDADLANVDLKNYLFVRLGANKSVSQMLISNTRFSIRATFESVVSTRAISRDADS